MQNLDVIILSAAHAMMLPNLPEQVKLSEESGDVFRPVDLEKFGFLSIKNPGAFSAGITEDDFKPKDEDFIYPVYRMLSETTVHASWNPISFAKPGVLKKAKNLLLGQTVNTNHDTDVEDAIGAVLDVQWQEGYELNGIKVPAGINAVLKIDAKANPRIARGVLMDPPSIHSNSVSVLFSWEKSHPDMEDNEFWDKLGTYGKDGKRIERVVNEIKAFQETSLVNHGADPWAQIVNDKGEIINPKYANTHSSLKQRIKEGKHRGSVFSFKQLKEHNSTILTESNNIQSKQKESQMENLVLLAAALGLQLPEGKEEWTETLLINQSKAANDALTQQINTLNTEKENLQTQLDDLKNKDVNEEVKTENTTLKTKLSAAEAIVNEVLTEVRSEAKRLYMAVNELTEDDTICQGIDAADYSLAKAYLKNFQAQFDKKFPNGRSSEDGGETEDKTGSEDFNQKLREARLKGEIK